MLAVKRSAGVPPQVNLSKKKLFVASVKKKRSILVLKSTEDTTRSEKWTSVFAVI